MLRQLMWSGPTPFWNQSLSLLNRPTLLLTHRPPTFLITSQLSRAHLLLSRNHLRRSLFKDNCLLPLMSPTRNLSLLVILTPALCLQIDPPLDILPEEGELSDHQEPNLSDHEQSLSEEQSYRETMRGIRSYMGWNHIPDTDSGVTTSEDNPFAGPKLHTPGKISVNLLTNEWLCRKMSKLNITLVQGYPTRTSEAGGLLKDQFVRPPKSQQKWYGFHPNPKKDSDQTVSAWHTRSSRLNSTYLRIARQAGIASSPPMSRPISQENLCKWERSARESTDICNNAASFNRCLLKIQENMNSQLKAIRVESKGKTAAKVSSAVDKLQFLLHFNSSVCQAMAKSMEHLTEFVFVNLLQPIYYYYYYIWKYSIYYYYYYILNF